MQRFIYIADDEENIREIVKSFLESEGYLVQAFADGDQLLASDDLANILLYHVVSGEYKAGDLTDGMELEALNGGKLLISISSVMVNDANVIAADVETANGVIHVLDAVLIPAEDVGDGDVELPQTGGYPYYVLGLLALAGGVLTLKKRK